MAASRSLLNCGSCPDNTFWAVGAYDERQGVKNPLG
jgi:hypothetical protein